MMTAEEEKSIAEIKEKEEEQSEKKNKAFKEDNSTHYKVNLFSFLHIFEKNNKIENINKMNKTNNDDSVNNGYNSNKCINIIEYKSKYKNNVVKEEKRMHAVTKKSTLNFKNKRHKCVLYFTQQKLKAWQPVLSPKFIIFSFFIFSLMFIVLAVILFTSYSTAIECTKQYGDPLYIPPSSNSSSSLKTGEIKWIQITAADCEGIANDVEEIQNDNIYIYYKLTNFYQNHRRYAKSVSLKQLKGSVFTHVSDLSSCHPLITDNDGKILSPCGLIASSIFNDTFTLWNEDSYIDNYGNEVKKKKMIDLDERRSVITWDGDFSKNFKNPVFDDLTDEQKNKINFWLPKHIFPGGVENAHFAVWMKNEALPNFKKLYAKVIPTKIKFPIWVKIENRYRANIFHGSKSIVVSVITWFGGRGLFLCVSYFIVGIICFIFGIILLVKHRNYPRILGDVRYLHWATQRRP